MSDYLVYKFDIKSQEFLNYLEINSNQVYSYSDLTNRFDDEVDILRDNISYELSMIDYLVNAYYEYGYSGYLNPTTFDNNLFETEGVIGQSLFRSSFVGENLLAPYNQAPFPMTMTEANFSRWQNSN